MHCTRGVLALGYASMSGYGLSHPTVNEVRLGYADVLLRHPISGAVFSAGRIRVSQAEIVSNEALMWLDLYEQFVRYKTFTGGANYPVIVHDRYLMASSPIPRWDTPMFHQAAHLTLLSAGREKRLYAVPPYTNVRPIEFTDVHFGVESQAGRVCAQTGAVNKFMMDHTPGQGQFRNLEHYVDFMAKWCNASPADIEAETHERLREAPSEQSVWRLTADIVALALAQDLPIASHDDDTLTKIDLMADLGVTISEFPVTLVAAQEARRRGIAVAIGAPNVLRGVSHTGNLSAIEAIAAGVVDMLASDYSPAPLLQATFTLVDRGILPLHEAVKLIGENPAARLGLRDRGRIAVGLAADVALIEPAQRPRVRGTIRRGLPIYWEEQHPDGGPRARRSHWSPIRRVVSGGGSVLHRVLHIDLLCVLWQPRFSPRAAAVRSATSCWRAASFKNAPVPPFQGRVSLFEPGTFSVTKTTCACTQRTFSTNWASVG